VKGIGNDIAAARKVETLHYEVFTGHCAGDEGYFGKLSAEQAGEAFAHLLLQFQAERGIGTEAVTLEIQVLVDCCPCASAKWMPVSIIQTSLIPHYREFIAQFCVCWIAE
jgi:hypothetical protein